MMHKWWMGCLAGGLVLLVGCAGTDSDQAAMTYLQGGDGQASRYDQSFWYREGQRQSPLWQQAQAWCQAHPDQPRCMDVKTAAAAL